MAAVSLQRIFKPNRFSLLISKKCPTRNNSNIINSALPNIEIPNTTIPNIIYERLNKYPKKIAVECGLTGKKFTFEGIQIASKNLNKNLRKKLKLQKGDVVAIMLPNVPEFPICVLGAIDAALTVTTINPMYTPGEIKRQLIDANAKALITLGSFWPTAQAAIKDIPNKIPILTIKMQESELLPEGAISFREFIEVGCDIEDVSGQCLDDIVLLPYSSGTTGLPKGVQLLQRNIMTNIMQFKDPLVKIAIDTTEDHQDVIPGILPWFHIYGVTIILLTHLYHLSKIISLPKFIPEKYINILATQKPNILFVVPPIVSFLSDHPSVQKKYLESVRTLVSGAAPLGKLDEEKFLTKMGDHIDILQGYGLTETSPGVLITLASRKKELQFTGSLGEPLPSTSVKVVPIDDPSGEALGPNQCGEILVKGPQVMKGYHNRPKETEDVFVDGWLRTGDIVYYDKNKMFYITDRLKELIKVKGFQVAPAELEEIIRSHPDITDAAVIGIDDEKYGEVPRAYVVLKQNVQKTPKELVEYVNNQVVNYKHLKGGLAIIDTIPKNAAGKIMRKDLKLQYEKQRNN